MFKIHIGRVGTAVAIGAILILCILYLYTQDLKKSLINNESTRRPLPSPVQISPTNVQDSTIINNTKLKTYTSTIEKASFKYPADWTIVKPSIESNHPNADQIAIQSPNGDIKVSWVSALDGFGGGCDDELPVGQEGGCPLFTLVEKIPISGSADLFVVSGTITRDRKIYHPFIAVQDTTKGSLTSTKRTMGYDMFTTRTGMNYNVLFSTSGAYGNGPALSEAEANAWFNKPNVKEAKQILESLTY